MCEPDIYRRLMKLFKDDLPVPMGLDPPCSFWFTEKGLQRFADAIDEINRYISETRWEIRCIVLWVHEMNYHFYLGLRGLHRPERAAGLGVPLQANFTAGITGLEDIGALGQSLITKLTTPEG